VNSSINGKNIVLGVTGGIAAYKACQVLRLLQEQGFSVRVVMTAAAQQFIKPLTFETLSGQEVVTDMFPDFKVVKTRHVSWAEWADAILICPATANIIGKTACGIADDFLSTLLMASRRPLIFAPAMDYEMVQNKIYLNNCKLLKSYGHHFIATQTGHLASGAIGPGRLAEPAVIVEQVQGFLERSEILQGKKVLVTAGPTREPLDPIRFISNRSTGTMGYELAAAAAKYGADVTLISGPVNLDPPSFVSVIKIETASQMQIAVDTVLPSSDIIIMAAAIADFTPVECQTQKIKKTADGLVLKFDRTRDILKAANGGRADQIFVGFALETETALENGKKKLQEKNLDLICINDASEKGAGFGPDTNHIQILDKSGKINDLGLLSKRKTAFKIIEKIISVLGL